jgi:DNA-binding NarL/FixJ family response regulator
VVAGVLLVDDDPAHLDLLRLLIELEDDLEVVGVARDGERGIELAAELQPAAIVSDIEMPRLDGLAATPRYREAAPHAVIVLMSSLLPSEAEPRARVAGADLYIDKGTGVETTIALLKHAVHAAAAGEPAVVDLRTPESSRSTPASRRRGSAT